MNLSKAIEINSNRLKAFPDIFDPDFRNATQLGIEALKRIMAIRKHQSYSVFPSLPGETKECCKFCGAVHPGIECPSREDEK